MGNFIIFALIVVYGGGVWKFWNGFGLTNRIGLSLLWPALFITNQSYRRNFRKALKG